MSNQQYIDDRITKIWKEWSVDGYDYISKGDLEFLQINYPIIAHAYYTMVTTKHSIAVMLELAKDGDL